MSHMSPMSIDRPHRRFNPLTGDWVLVSPQRTQRPWQGRTEAAAGGKRPAHDPRCYLCPGNERAGGATNPPYTGTFVFDNDYPALMAADEARAPAIASHDATLLRRETVNGVCRVVCFSPRHDLSLAELSPGEIAAVIDTFAGESATLGQRYAWVQAFENKGEIMGCSNPHPHGQIWASDTLPNEAAAEDCHQRTYAAAKGSSLLVDYAHLERQRGERVVHENASFLAVVPYWAVWPFETLILPTTPVARLPDLSPAARQDLGALLGSLLAAYDRLFDVSFPYSMGWHGAPFLGDQQMSHWQLHAHIYPPLLRSATVKKFMVGYELLAEPQRDLTPETAAERLRDLIR
jgi:UDPglucose--hexose-1-phosphate uridylyltransferase